MRTNGLPDPRFMLVGLALLATVGKALSQPVTVSDVDDDATLSLTVDYPVFVGDLDWCSTRILVTGNDVSFSAGDSITVQVYEDDVAADDLLFQWGFVITSAELAAQLVDRTFDCSSVNWETDICGDLGGFAEIYAAAEVIKDECGVFCADDQPTTVTLDVPCDISTGVAADDFAATAIRFESRPNPFEFGTTLRFRLDRPSTVSLEIYNLAGRNVRTLAHGTRSAGFHEVAWDGRTDGGEDLPAGVYFARLVTDRFTKSVRIHRFR